MKKQLDGSVDSRDVRVLLRLIADLSENRGSGVAWRQQLLAEMCPLLGAQVGLTVHAQHTGADSPPMAVLVVDHGLREGAGRRALLSALHADLLRNPFAKALYDQLGRGKAQLVTGRREDYVSDAEWKKCEHCAEMRAQTKVEHTLVSVFAGPGPSGMSAVVFCRSVKVRKRFGVRERTLLHLCHEAITRLYVSEHAAQGGGPLTPRQRQTLSYLTAGRSEKEIADVMGLSPHTVHDHVKAIYRQFGVSSRSELLSRFIQ